MTWAGIDFRPTVREATRDAIAPPLLAYIAAKPVRTDGSRIFCADKARRVLVLAYRTVTNELKQMKTRGTVERYEYARDGDYRVWLTPLGERLAKEDR